ncbi:MAG: 3-keto-5-aminohexanoate cleavage protein [bacterium]|nr:3-keto-5-aminohexanoate cleavage protein [bacterium]
MAAVANEEVPAIIEVAINGITSPNINPNVPLSPEAIGADALACLEGGAAIIHTHNHDISLTGEAAAHPYIEAMAPVLAARPDALWYPTLTSGDHQAKYAHMAMIAAEMSLRMVVVDPGSTNIGGAGPDGLPVGGTYKNDYAEIRASFDLCRDNGWASAMAIYEPGFLQCVLTYHRVGQLPAGSMAKLYFGARTQKTVAFLGVLALFVTAVLIPTFA